MEAAMKISRTMSGARLSALVVGSLAAMLAASPSLAQVNANTLYSSLINGASINVIAFPSSAVSAHAGGGPEVNGGGPPSFDKTASTPPYQQDNVIFTSGGLDYHLAAGAGLQTVRTTGANTGGVVTITNFINLNAISDLVYTKSSTQAEKDWFSISLGSLTETNVLRLTDNNPADATYSTDLSLSHLVIKDANGTVFNGDYHTNQTNVLFFPLGSVSGELNSGSGSAVTVSPTETDIIQDLQPLSISASAISINGIEFDISAEISHSFSIIGLIVQSAVPEPATWVEMLLGVGLVGAAMRGRRGKIQAA
jgi:hypothetical protein